MSNDMPFPELAGGNNILLREAVSKTKIAAFANDIVSLVGSGDEDALDLYMKAKITNEMTSEVLKKVKDDAIVAAAKYGKTDNLMYGCKFEVTNGTTTYYYNHDNIWNDLNDKMSAIKEEMKAREEAMKVAFKFKGDMVDDDGVVVPPARIKGGSGEQLKISIPKL